MAAQTADPTAAAKAVSWADETDARRAAAMATSMVTMKDAESAKTREGLSAAQMDSRMAAQRDL